MMLPEACKFLFLVTQAATDCEKFRVQVLSKNRTYWVHCNRQFNFKVENRLKLTIVVHSSIGQECKKFVLGF